MSTEVKQYELFDRAIAKASKIYRLGENASKIFELSEALQYISGQITPEKMKSIMMLQGNKIGFKTDKDKNGGYPENVVKTCIIDAMMTGVLATGNQFNIISDGMYITKEGFFHLLKNITTLEDYETIPLAESFVQNKNNTANISCLIKYKEVDKEAKEMKRTYIIKNHSSYGSFDGVVGKMERKARKDLYEKLTGIELAEGEADSYNGLDKGKEINPNQTAANTESALFSNDNKES